MVSFDGCGQAHTLGSMTLTRRSKLPSLLLASLILMVGFGCEGEPEEQLCSGNKSTGQPLKDTDSRCEGDVALSCEPGPCRNYSFDKCRWYIKRRECGSGKCVVDERQEVQSGSRTEYYTVAECR